MDIVPYVVLGLGIISFIVWWQVYIKEARHPDGRPPSMWVMAAVHAAAILLGFLVPFFINVRTIVKDKDGNTIYFISALRLTEQWFYFDLAIGLSMFVLLVVLLIGTIRALK
ncbi:MAG: hypothetical protein WCT04_12515 [Planctomycetota bacterium]